MASPDKMVSLEEVAARYRVSKPTIHRWVQSQGFPVPIRMGRSWYWIPEDLDKFDRWRQQVAMSHARLSRTEVKVPEYSVGVIHDDSPKCEGALEFVHDRK